MLAKSEGQLALDLAAAAAGGTARSFDDAEIRAEMATRPGLEEMANAIFHPEAAAAVEPDMVYVEL